MDRAVFLDRDNTLIVNDGDLGDPSRVRLLDGVGTGLKALSDAGYRLVVVTNQAGVARGAMSEADVVAVHRRIGNLVEQDTTVPNLIERFYFCPYHPEATADAYRRDHPWRKPQPGMLLQAARDLEIDLASSWMIGDQPRDIAAGQSAGCRTVLLGSDGGSIVEVAPTVAVERFSEAVRYILSRTPPEQRKVVASDATTAPGAAARPAAAGTDPDIERLHRSIVELTDELRSDRVRRAEFTLLRLGAVIAQLLVLLLLLLGLLQLQNTEAFLKWMAGAVLLQLATITMLVVDGNR